MPPRVRLEVDLTALAYNTQTLKAHAKQARLMAVVKANAYGLGMADVIPAVLSGGADALGVATAAEAQRARHLYDGDIYLLGSFLQVELPLLLATKAILPVASCSSLTWLSEAAKKQGQKTLVHLLVDTGMGRLGIQIKDAPDIFKKIQAAAGLELCGVYSHLSNAFKAGDPHTYKQITLFQKLKQELSKLIREDKTQSSAPIFHLANSDGLHNYPEACFDMVRSGINLYNGYDFEGKRRYDLLPVVALRSRIIALRRLPAGATIGYGRTHLLREATWIATVAAGYADGVPLALGNKCDALLRGKRYPIVGRISMDYLTLALGSCDQGSSVGETVTLLGEDETERITLDDWAKYKKTHSYDILTSISERVSRVYHGTFAKTTKTNTKTRTKSPDPA